MTMRLYLRKLLIMAAVSVLVSCTESLPMLFDDISGVYFNNLSGTMAVTDSVDLTFVYQSGDEMDVPVKLQLVGRPADHDREVAVTISSDDAVEGTDYRLNGKAVIPSGASAADYVVTLLRTPALKNGKKMIEMTISANEHFDLPVTEHVQLGDTVSTLNFRIYFCDMFTKAPAAWDDNLVGDFSQQKFELICDVLGIDPADFNDQSKMTLAKLLYISAEMTAYVKAEVAKKDAGEEYDENVFDIHTGEPLSFI